MTKAPKPPKVNPWDRRPWPTAGDSSVSLLYYCVGLFLSQWERHEVALSALFTSFVSGQQRTPARRAYVAVRTFEARVEILRAASEAYFEDNPNTEHQDKLKDVLRNAKQYSERRNDIAHGVVDFFCLKDDWDRPRLENAYALYPSQASFKERTTAGIPSYCMTSAEIHYFFEKIFELQRPALDLVSAIERRKTPRPSLRTLYEPRGGLKQGVAQRTRVGFFTRSDKTVLAKVARA